MATHPNRTGRVDAGAAPSELAVRVIDSPVGELHLGATPRGLALIAFGPNEAERKLRAFGDRVRIAKDPSVEAERILDETEAELAEYFAGDRREFTVALDWLGAEGFRARAQTLLTSIPYGETVSYAELAAMAGSPRAVRAAGSACASNPLPLVTPCHRVVRADGSPGGYGAGLAAKQMLLALEARESRP